MFVILSHFMVAQMKTTLITVAVKLTTIIYRITTKGLYDAVLSVESKNLKIIFYLYGVPRLTCLGML